MLVYIDLGNLNMLTRRQSIQNEFSEKFHLQKGQRHGNLLRLHRPPHTKFEAPAAVMGDIVFDAADCIHQARQSGTVATMGSIAATMTRLTDSVIYKI